MIDERKLIEEVEYIKKNNCESLCEMVFFDGILALLENFPKVENTENFKNFKLYSDSTLKNTSKDDLIDYLHMIYSNWKNCDVQLDNTIKENYRISNQLVEISRVCKSKDERIEELTSNPPLKFEELKENMVVWDNKRKMFIKIFDTATLEENFFSFEVFGWEVPIYDEQFEENRFYRYEVK